MVLVLVSDRIVFGAAPGTGVNLRTQRPTPEAVADAVDRALGEDGLRTAARSIAAEIAAVPGVLPACCG